MKMFSLWLYVSIVALAISIGAQIYTNSEQQRTIGLLSMRVAALEQQARTANK